MAKNKGGRPTKMTEDTVKKLEEAFKNDFTDYEACLYAGISRETYYNHREKDPKFVDRVSHAKQFPFFLAKKNVMAALKSGQIEDTWKFLSKRQKEIYSDRMESIVDQRIAMVDIDEMPEDLDLNKLLKKKSE